MYLRDLNINQCFSFLGFSTIYRVTKQLDSISKTCFCPVNNNSDNRTLNSDKFVQFRDTDEIGVHEKETIQLFHND